MMHRYACALTCTIGTVASAQTPTCPSIVHGVGERALHFAQLKPPSLEPDRYCYSEYGIDIDAVALSSFLYGAADGDTILDFIGVDNDVDDIEARLENHATNWGIDAENFDGHVLVDIEKVAHPKTLYQLSPMMQSLVIARYADCFTATRNVYPDAEIVWYGIPTSNGQGVVDDSVDAMIDAVTSTHSGYDELDAIAPVLYPRWGPDDVGPGEQFATNAELVSHLRGIVTETMDFAWDIANAADIDSNRCLEVLPLVSFEVFNPNSKNNHNYIIVDDPDLSLTLGPIVDQIDLEGASRLAFWSAWDGDVLGDGLPAGVEIGDYYVELLYYFDSTSRSIPFIRLPGDTNDDSCLSSIEASTLTSAIVMALSDPYDPCLDLNDDGQINILDVHLANLLGTTFACP